MNKEIDTICATAAATATATAAIPLQAPATVETSRWRQALAGLRAIIPILPGVVPFGMIAGAGAITVGFSAVQAQGMSLLVFAGASQVVAIDLIGRGATWPAVVFAMMIVNLRFVMYSAAIAPVLPGMSRLQKLVGAYLLTDQGFAVTVNRHRQLGSRKGSNLFIFYFGASFALWSTWQLGTLAGIFLGSVVPPSWDLGFTIPLMFLALLAPTLKNRASWSAAVAAGLVATVGRGLPHNLSLMVGALTGVAIGLIVEWRFGAIGKGERA